MKRLLLSGLVVVVAAVGCSRRPAPPVTPSATATGSVLVEVSGGKQVTQAGMTLDQPVTVQVNDAEGNGVAGAEVVFQGPAGVRFAPDLGLTDSSGQFSSVVTLGSLAGRYQVTATTKNKGGQPIRLVLDEIALGYQPTLGRELYRQYCDRCHDPESSAQRVSNFDNLVAKPHPFTEGESLNKFTDADLAAIISHGGPALGKSAEMPAYGYTLSQRDIQALISYIRAVSTPPYGAKGLVYAKVGRPRNP
jgi:mono/diheme cytochrome c family protein